MVGNMGSPDPHLVNLIGKLLCLLYEKQPCHSLQ